MARKYCSQEFREQIAGLVRSGRRPAELSREFEPTAQTILNWVEAANGSGGSGSKRDEAKENRRLRRELRRVQEERNILAKTTAWFGVRDLEDEIDEREIPGLRGACPGS